MIDINDENIFNLDFENIKNNINDYSTEKLCEIIVCSRYLSIDKKLTIFCMEELGKRREKGDQFEFEKFIEESFNKLPVLSFSIPDLKSMLTKLSKEFK